MFCSNCGSKLEKGDSFCHNCGKSTLEIAEATLSMENVKAFTTEEPEAVVKCGNCDYVGEGERARSKVMTVLAWVCILFAPLITIIYFVATHKYRCPKCKSTFLGVKNKEGVFAGQRGGLKSPVMIFVLILVFIAIIGILASITLASLNTARQKAREAREASERNINSLNR